MENLSNLYKAIVNGKLELAMEATKKAIDNGSNPQLIIDNYMIKAMEEVGQRFEIQQAFVPELLMAGRAMKGALEILKPLLEQNGKSSSLGKVVIGTVKGDLHDIGKNLVASMFEGCGFDVINLGVDVSTEKFMEAYNEHHPQIICLSALLTTTMPAMKMVIDTFEEAGLRKKVKFMVGGAPVSERFAKQIGADGYSNNANAAINLAKSLINA